MIRKMAVGIALIAALAVPARPQVSGGVSGGVPGGVLGGRVAGVPGGALGGGVSGRVDAGVSLLGGLGPQSPEQEREQERQERDREKKEREEEQRERDRERLERLNELYEDATDALDESKWEQAAEKFGRVAQAGGPKTDGALYWRAYALNKLGRRAEALATLQALAQKHPNSRWIADAKALENEVRQAAGQTVRPENVDDEELKLLAINSLMHRDPDEAVPLLEGVLKGASSPKLKERALFVLAINKSPRARELMVQIGRGASNPDLQKKAVQYLGLHGGKEGRQALEEIYAATGDPEVKSAILHSYMVGGERAKLLAAAKGESSAELRGQAIHWLGVMGAQEELWQLYAAESSVAVKKKILHSLAIGGRVDRLIEVARSESNPELRKQAIHGLGIAGAQRTGDALLTLYAAEKEREVRKQILHALFIQGNAKVLVDLARKETDPEMKKEIVQRLSLMRSKEATDYLMELLKP